MKVQRQVVTPPDGPAYYWLILRPWFRLMALAMLVAVLITLAVTKSLLTHYYRATAIIRPVSKADQGNLASGLLAGVTEGFGSLVSGLASDEEKDAEKYTSILTSYAFTMQLLKRDNLAPHLIERSLSHRLFAWPVSDYRLYQKMGKLFDADYNLKTGNLNLAFLDPDRAVAQKVLGDYVNLLRARLRQHEIDSAASAISALQKEAGATSDAQLQSALYDSIAKQIQRRGMAEVQADFSFEVIDPPIASDLIYKPKIGLDCMLAALLTCFAAMLIIIAGNNLSSQLAQPHRSEVPSAPVSTVEEESTPHRLKRQG